MERNFSASLPLGKKNRTLHLLPQIPDSQPGPERGDQHTVSVNMHHEPVPDYFRPCTEGPLSFNWLDKTQIFNFP